MEITITRAGRPVGTYDETTKRLTTDDPELRKLVGDELTVRGGTTLADGTSVDTEVKVRPGEPRWFFALVDVLWAADYDVDQATYAELLRRFHAQ